MVQPFHPRLLQYLDTVQRSTRCAGIEELYRANQQTLPHPRTIYRWHKDLGKRLVLFPVFTVGHFGLVDLHLFLNNPRREWLRFPYAVEHAWLTPDLYSRVLYLHCVIPAAHRDIIERLVRDLQRAGMCERYELLWTDSGWQFLNLVGSKEVPGWPSASLDVTRPEMGQELIRRLPLVIPVVFEAWNQHRSLQQLWVAIQNRVGSRLKEFLPRQQIYRVNGKAHVKEIYHTLVRAGIFRQYLLRYQPLVKESVAVFLMLRVEPEQVVELFEELRSTAWIIEIHRAAKGWCLVRLLGSHELLNVMIALPGCFRNRRFKIYFHEKRDASDEQETVRFCYEFLFDPARARWSFPRSLILKRMQVKG